MRSLRYRIVTFVAVMLALAAGIILGNGPLQGDETVSTVSGSSDNDKLSAAQQQLAQQQQELAYADSFAAATGNGLVDRKLAGRAVTVITLPGADPDDVDRVVAEVGTAGGTVAGTVALDEKLLDVGQRQLVSELARQMDAGATKKAVEVPKDAGDYSRVGRMLAYSLLTGDAGGDQPDRAAQGILAGLTTADLVALDGDLTRRGSVALVVGGPPYGSADERSGAGSILTELLASFDRVGDGTVLAAPLSASAPDGLVTAVRADPSVAKVASTVDVVDQAAGPAVAVLALAQDVAGTSGDYGSTEAADGPVPGAQAGTDEAGKAQGKKGDKG